MASEHTAWAWKQEPKNARQHLILLALAEDCGHDGISYELTQEDLAAKVKITATRALRQYLNQLADDKLIRIYNRQHPVNKRKMQNIYALNTGDLTAQLDKLQAISDRENVGISLVKGTENPEQGQIQTGSTDPLQTGSTDPLQTGSTDPIGQVPENNNLPDSDRINRSGHIHTYKHTYIQELLSGEFLTDNDAERKGKSIRPHRIPEAWQPTPALVARLINKDWIPGEKYQAEVIKEAVEEFVTYWHSNGTARAGWDNTFVKFIGSRYGRFLEDYKRKNGVTAPPATPSLNHYNAPHQMEQSGTDYARSKTNNQTRYAKPPTGADICGAATQRLFDELSAEMFTEHDPYTDPNADGQDYYDGDTGPFDNE